jgi:chromosome segregation ATPase
MSDNINQQNLSIIQMQGTIQQLLSDLNKLTGQVAAISAGCNVRHRLNLTAELSKIETTLKQLKSDISKLEQDQGNLQKEIQDLHYEHQALSGRVNIVSVKIEEIEANAQKSKDNKNNFIIQIVILVVATIITSIIGVAISFTWKRISCFYTRTAKNSKTTNRN